MSGLNFTWDEKKAKSNLLKHQVSFAEAQTVFEDVNARLILDPDHSDSILLGLSIKSKILTVVHCYRDDEENIRIISARKSTKAEAKKYKEFLL